MSESLIERIAAFFARDKEAYWWQLITDYERSLSKTSRPNRAIDSDAWQALRALAGARHRRR